MSGFQRKRRFGNDDYQERFQKRPRLPPMLELAKSLCADLNTLGESAAKYVEDVEFMSVPIVSNFENEKVFRDAVLNTIYAITTEQPQKITHIAGLIQVIDTQNKAVGKTIVEFFHQKAQEILNTATETDTKPDLFETGSWNKLKLILRLLSSLSFIINAESLTNIFKQFLNLANDLQNNNTKRSPLGEAIFYNTLLSIPYLTIYEPDFSRDSIQSLLNIAENFKLVANKVTITTPFDEKSPFEQNDIVSLILPSIRSQIETPTDIFINFRTLLRDQLQQAEKHEIPQLSFPTVDDLRTVSGLDKGLGSVDGMWRTPRITFQVYLPIDGFSTTPSTDSYVGLLARDITTDIVEALEFNRKEVARQIITLDLFFKDGLFAPPGSGIDTLKEIHQNNTDQDSKASTWKTEDIAVETVLSLIFKLPTASQPSVYFYAVLVEACTNASQAIAPVMGRAIRFFYASLIHLDFELRLRYLDWLSVQLSNFNFTWKWREWENDSISQSKSDYHPKISFIRNLISKELRLTSREKIQGTLTEEFHKYLKNNLFEEEEIKDYYTSLFPDLENVDFSFSDDSSKFFFIRDNVPLKEKVELLIESIHKDTGKEEYVSIINSIKDDVKDYPNSEKLLISLVFQTISFIGNRSISHATKYFGNASKVLKTIIEESSDENKENHVIEAILVYWNKESYNGFLILDIAQSFGLISPLSKLKYVLNDDRKRNIGLVDVAAIESIFGTLTSSVYSKNNKEELLFSFRQFVSILSKTITKLNASDAISIPDIDSIYDETNELKWKYHTVLGFVRSVLRNFSDEYSSIEDELKTISQENIEHESTVSIIESWINELRDL